MKVSTAADGSLIIQCERFEAGREPFALPTPTPIEFVYLLFLILSIYFSGFNLLEYLVKIELNIVDYWNSHLLNSIAVWFIFITVLASLINTLFFKRVIIRTGKTYRIDRDACILLHPGYNYHKNTIAIDENYIDPIDKINMNDDLEVRITYDTESECELSYSSTIYKVVVKFRSGESSTIESNGLGVSSCNDNQVAFRELMTETKTAVEQIKSFLAASKNEITPSSD